MICPQCEKPLMEGDQVRVQAIAVFHKAVSPLHALDIYHEEWVEHLNCGNNSGSGD